MTSKILTIVGARPQFIKASAVSAALQQAGLEEVLVHTGQHYDANLSQVFFHELGIPRPRHHLGVGSGTHGHQTGQMLAAIEDVMLAEKPHWVLVYGDTNSTLAGALAAVKLHVPVGHVEAGLRSFNRRMPEEVNRVLTDHAADLLFVPTRAGVENLAKEGITGRKVALVGDVMYDACRRHLPDARHRDPVPGIPGDYVLATLHRAENTDDPRRLRTLLESLAEMAEEIAVVLPMHPRTRRAAEQAGLDRLREKLRVIEPVGYLDMLALEQRAKLIATDSGGVQKEAFFCRVPCVTLRDETEWVELIELGWNRLAPPVDRQAVVNQLRAAMAGGPGRQPPNDLYGGGHAAQRIAELLAES